VLVDQTRRDLEMTDRGALRPAAPPKVPVSVARCDLIGPEYARFLHSAVGFRWHWTSRLAWSYQEWLDWLGRPEVENWVVEVGGAPAGFCELEAEPDEVVQLNSFGLLSPFHGLGLGGFFLTRVVERAWDLHADLGGRTRLVWLHTNSLDGPHALDNYRARGFTVVREHRLQRELPDELPQPWPGAAWRPGLDGPRPSPMP
jgi:GNAT superfamily N-acetyltransferase